MTDRQDNFAGRRDIEGESVTTLASRALEAIVSRKARGRSVLSERLMDQLVNAAHAARDDALDAAVSDLLHAGVPHSEALDFYIPEVARRLGDAWCDDRLSFTAVTIGTARLQRAVRRLSHDSRGANEWATEGSVLVIAPEGQAHTLGATLVTEQLRRQNVSVRLMVGASERDILATVAEGSFDAVFISIAVEEALAQIRSLVKKLKPVIGGGVPVAVGGAVLNNGADVKKNTGADHVVSDVREALRLCGLTSSRQDAAQPVSET